MTWRAVHKLRGGYESAYGDRKQGSQALHGPSGSMKYLEFGYEPGPGERKQAWQALHRPSGPMQCLQLGYESGLGKHKETKSSCDEAHKIGFWFWGPSNRSGHGESKQAWQALNGPYGPIQCLQFGERKQTSKTLNLNDLEG